MTSRIVHQYADDIQIYFIANFNSTENLLSKISCCLNTVMNYMDLSKLKLNDSKTKLIQWNSVNKSTVNKSSRLLHPICLERNRLEHFRKRRLLKPSHIKSKTGCPEVDLLTEFHCINDKL